MAVQQSFAGVKILPQGVFHFREFLGRDEQVKLRDALRAVVKQAPFFRPVMPYGNDFKLDITNAGEFGWLSDQRGGMRYVKRQPRREKDPEAFDKFEGKPWPAIPEILLDATRRAAQEARMKYTPPNVCLLNLYEAVKGSLGKHRDDTKGEDLNDAIYTFALGGSCEFGIGGLDYKDEYEYVDFNSGDVMIFTGISRLIYHEVRNVTNNSDLLAHGGRISATLRRALYESRGPRR